MQSAWSRLRERISFAELPTILLVAFLAQVVAQSTIIMAWVNHSEVFTPVAFLAVVVMSVLALARVVPTFVALTLGAIGTALVPWYLNATALHAAHPSSPFGVPSPDTWLNSITGSTETIDASLFLFLGSVIFWVVGGWLAWCTLRWRKPILGIFPGAAVFATNVLNSKDEQNANTLYFLLLTIALLLWSNYRASLLRALKSGLRLSSDSRWDFWETGVAATAGVMLLAIFVPPLTHDDQTVNVENGVFRNWAEFQQNLNHPVEVGRGGTAAFSSGFALDAGLNGPLRRSDRVVFVYNFNGQYLGPRYFRGVNLQNGNRPNQWAYLNNQFGFQFFVGKNQNVSYADGILHEQNGSTIQVHMLRPPANAPDLLFYPGQLNRTDRDAIAVESYKAAATPSFGTVDRVASSHPATSAGFYKVTVSYANPTEDELRNAGTDYAAWLVPYLSYPGLTGTPAFTTTNGGTSGQASNNIVVIGSGGVTSPTTLKIKALADQVTAKLTNNYDKAAAIESYLRSNYTYTLTPPVPKDGTTDPIGAFLFDAKTGYCEYFATAMGDMLRAEGIPTRLVNGFGPGTYDSKIKQYVVKESDAHTWVEAFFPGYGWIPFEPTPDGNYYSIPRAQAPNTCNRDQCATGDSTVDTAGGSAARAKALKDLGGDVPNQTGPLGGSGQFPLWLLIPFGFLLLGAVAFFAASRYLRPHTAGEVWTRLGVLSRLAGDSGPAGETPSETGRRLAAAYPEMTRPIHELTDSFVVAAYGPAEAARRR
ncbi:MAG: transglutaminase domain-containing protein, partial [Candidatus Dormibacteraeota bacterium]|nr:transglutaminase domain-containing protein [Candidatus Dormibacteraeota bacterium]